MRYVTIAAPPPLSLSLEHLHSNTNYTSLKIIKYSMVRETSQRTLASRQLYLQINRSDRQNIRHFSRQGVSLHHLTSTHLKLKRYTFIITLQMNWKLHCKSKW
jgi:hypothetical protein